MRTSASVEQGVVSSAASLLTADEAAHLAAFAEQALQAISSHSQAGWQHETVDDPPAAGPAHGLLMSYVRRWREEGALAKRVAEGLSRQRSLIRLRELSQHRWLRCALARPQPAANPHMASAADLGAYIQQSYALIAKRPASAAEVELWLAAIEGGHADIHSLVQGLLLESASTQVHDLAQAQAQHSVIHPCWVMGTNEQLAQADWEAQLAAAPVRQTQAARYRGRFPVLNGRRPKVSALLSLWRGGAHIGRFMDNITSQDGFAEHCELIIVDAASPDREIDVIQPYLNRWSNIIYRRCDQRIGIYDAWNRSIALACGDYLTSTNVDDMRRHDSLLLQAGALDCLPFVDVVYQDFLYTLDPDLPFDAIERVGRQSRLPIITPYNLLRYNPPHNAPMWRRELHHELGLFDTGYESAADYEFWLRCLASGKVFYKLNDPHVAYFHNPDGLSTRAGSSGPLEARRITTAYASRVIPRDATVGDAAFIASLATPMRTAVGADVRRRWRWADEALRNTALCSPHT